MAVTAKKTNYKAYKASDDELKTYQKIQYLKICWLACEFRDGNYSKNCKEEMEEDFRTELEGVQGYECFLSNVQALRKHEYFALFQKDIEFFVQNLPALYRAYKMDKNQLYEFDLL